MNILVRVAIVLTLASLITVMAAGAIFAQDASPFDQGLLQPQIAQEVVASWKDAHPLEFYLALPVTEYLAVARMPSLANAHPLEYYLAFPIGSEVVQEQYNGMYDVAMEAGQ